jgi:NAD(P)-dependent dehydrogenase (short-subunit alcohol dehydrogenase family)
MTEKPPIKINRCGLSYTDKVTIITGASKGIGEGCARVFVDAGAKVVICARGAKDGQDLAKELSRKGPGTCDFIQCDVSKPEQIQSLMEQTIKKHGRLDCLINNAGYHPGVKRIDEFTVEEFHDVLNTNLVSYWLACKFALPYLRKTKGSIINMSSLVGEMGQEGATTYCATKGGINGFTKALAIEEGSSGVRINAVLPGNIITNSRIVGVASCENPNEVDKWVDSNQHNGRSGTNEEVGQACLFLASDAASYISGIMLNMSYGAELGYGIKYPVYFLSMGKGCSYDQ